MTDRATRREYLLAAGTLAAAGLAGCSSDGGGPSTTATDDPTTELEPATQGTTDDSTTEDTTTAVSVPNVEFPTLDAPSPTYRNWLPADDEYALGFWSATNFERLREVRSEISPGDVADAVATPTAVDYIGIEFEEMTGTIGALSGPGIIYPGEFDREKIGTVLLDTGYEQYETNGDRVFYRRMNAEGEVSARVAVAGHGVIHNFGGDRDTGFVPWANALFETAAGERTRRHEEDELLRKYTDAVGWPFEVGPFVAPDTGDGIGSIAGYGDRGIVQALPKSAGEATLFGRAEYVTDGTLVERDRFYLTGDGDLSREELRSALDSEDAREAAADASVAVREDADAIEAAVINPVENAGNASDPLLFTLRASLESGTLTLRHLAGDPVPRERLSLVVGTETSGLGEGALGPGESITADVSADAAGSIRVMYVWPNAESRTVVVNA